MSKCVILLLLLLSCCYASKANDGVFYAQGNTLFPIKETAVRLDKEILKLKRIGDYMAVDVYFEFFNPGPEKTVIVGFVTPPADGDVDDSTAQHPQIRQFTAVLNGQELPFKIARLNGSGFKFSEEEFGGDDFVYYFDVKFMPGLNKIQHQYEFRGGSSVDLEIDFPYRLTTGNMWANGEIADFTMEIDMGERELFTVPWSFSENGPHAVWTINGLGNVAKDCARVYMDNCLQAVYMSKGTLQMKKMHFHPEKDFWIGIFHPYMEFALWDPGAETHAFAKMMDLLPPLDADPESLAELSLEELWVLRNYPYAIRGYVFKSADLREFYSTMLWYDPLPKLKMGDIHLDAYEQALVEAVIQEEKRRK
jgi:hypothetical protein